MFILAKEAYPIYGISEVGAMSFTWMFSLQDNRAEEMPLQLWLFAMNEHAGA